jgi:hypothetical protein
MPKVTPSYAKNVIRRALRSVVDAEPDNHDVSRMWKHFESTCAYCGHLLIKTNREGQADHLVSATRGGINHISNRVLSCPPCNGDEKRDEDWLEFLRKKNPDSNVFETRRRRVESWVVAQAPSQMVAIDMGQLNREIERAVSAFDAAIANLRQKRSSPRP